MAGIDIASNFSLGAALPIDDKLNLSKAQMLTINENIWPDKYFTICTDDGKLYLYNKANPVNPETGRFREIEGGSGQTIQVTELPVPTAGLAGTILEFVGETGLDYTNGYFYQCVESTQEPGTYEWVQKNVQPSGGSGSSDTIPVTDVAGTVSQEILYRGAESNALIETEPGKNLSFKLVDYATVISKVTAWLNDLSQPINPENDVVLASWTLGTRTLKLEYVVASTIYKLAFRYYTTQSGSLDHEVYIIAFDISNNALRVRPVYSTSFCDITPNYTSTLPSTFLDDCHNLFNVLDFPHLESIPVKVLPNTGNSYALGQESLIDDTFIKYLNDGSSKYLKLLLSPGNPIYLTVNANGKLCAYKNSNSFNGSPLSFIGSGADLLAEPNWSGSVVDFATEFGANVTVSQHTGPIFDLYKVRTTALNQPGSATCGTLIVKVFNTSYSGNKPDCGVAVYYSDAGVYYQLAQTYGTSSRWTGNWHKLSEIVSISLDGTPITPDANGNVNIVAAQKFQYEYLPQASAENEGQIIQLTTNAYNTVGSFYQCQYNEEFDIYQWNILDTGSPKYQETSLQYIYNYPSQFTYFTMTADSIYHDSTVTFAISMADRTVGFLTISADNEYNIDNVKIFMLDKSLEYDYLQYIKYNNDYNKFLFKVRGGSYLTIAQISGRRISYTLENSSTEPDDIADYVDGKVEEIALASSIQSPAGEASILDDSKTRNLFEDVENGHITANYRGQAGTSSSAPYGFLTDGWQEYLQNQKLYSVSFKIGSVDGPIQFYIANLGGTGTITSEMWSEDTDHDAVWYQSVSDSLFTFTPTNDDENTIVTVLLDGSDARVSNINQDYVEDGYIKVPMGHYIGVQDFYNVGTPFLYYASSSYSCYFIGNKSEELPNGSGGHTGVNLGFIWDIVTTDETAFDEYLVKENTGYVKAQNGDYQAGTNFSGKAIWFLDHNDRLNGKYLSAISYAGKIGIPMVFVVATVDDNSKKFMYQPNASIVDMAANDYANIGAYTLFTITPTDTEFDIGAGRTIYKLDGTDPRVTINTNRSEYTAGKGFLWDSTMMLGVGNQMVQATTGAWFKSGLTDGEGFYGSDTTGFTLLYASTRSLCVTTYTTGEVVDVKSKTIKDLQDGQKQLVSYVDNQIETNDKYHTVLRFKSLNPHGQLSTLRFAFFGDSITEGRTYGALWDSTNNRWTSNYGVFTTKENYANVFCRQVYSDGTNVISPTMLGNFGVAGQTVSYIAGRSWLMDSLTSHLAECSDADIIFVADGINDRGQSVTAGTFRAYVQQAFDYILANKSARNQVCILLPWNQNNFHRTATTDIDMYRQIEYEEAIKRGFSVVDTSTYSPLKTNTGYMGTSTTITRNIMTWRVDGIHPSVAGYRYIGQQLAHDIFGNPNKLGEVTDFTSSEYYNCGPAYVGTIPYSYNGVYTDMPVFKTYLRNLTLTGETTQLGSCDVVDPYFRQLIDVRGYVATQVGTASTNYPTRKILPYNDPLTSEYFFITGYDDKTAGVGLANQKLNIRSSASFRDSTYSVIEFAPEIYYTIVTKQTAFDLE